MYWKRKEKWCIRRLTHKRKDLLDMKERNYTRVLVNALEKQAPRLTSKSIIMHTTCPIENYSLILNDDDTRETIHDMLGEIVIKRPSILEASSLRRNERTIDMSRCLIDSVRR